MTLDEAIADLKNCADQVVKMRYIIDNENLSVDLRYEAAVTEDAFLELMRRYLDFIDHVKGLDIK